MSEKRKYIFEVIYKSGVKESYKSEATSNELEEVVLTMSASMKEDIPAYISISTNKNMTMINCGHVSRFSIIEGDHNESK